MPTAICNDTCLWIANVGCGLTRTALLALEPGARIWLSIEGQLQLFERMRDGADGRSTRGLKPIANSGTVWIDSYAHGITIVELEFVERPADEGAASSKYYPPFDANSKEYLDD